MSRRQHKAAAKSFRRSDADWRRLVMFAEGRSDHAHLGPVLDRLLDHHDMKVSYLTGEADDPVLDRQHPNLAAYAVGDGSVRTVLMRDLEARVLVTTTPDFGRFDVKRSIHDVHYVYLFHAVVSTHMVYRPGAFDAFDTMLCVGPHHAHELRAEEAHRGLDRRRLVKHGYGRLDALLAEADQHHPDPRRVVLAGTWGDHAFMEQPIGDDIIARLVAAGYEVVARIHPMTQRRLPDLADRLRHEHDDAGLRVETDMGDRSSLLSAAVLVTDWSGAAFDHAFGLGRPVVSIDMPPKVNNPRWHELGIEPLEKQLRPELGAVVAPGSLAGLVPAIDELAGELPAWSGRLAERRDENVYNVGRSAEAAAEWLAAAVS